MTSEYAGPVSIVPGAGPGQPEPSAELDVLYRGFENDVTMRDWQYRSPQWLSGKTFEATTPFGPVLVTPFGPVLVTPDELPGGTSPALTLTCTVDGATVQHARTDDLVFGPVELVSYASTILTLRPGDVIATGTPGGVGHARTPRRYLTKGAVLETTIERIGTLRNIAEPA